MNHGVDEMSRYKVALKEPSYPKAEGPIKPLVVNLEVSEEELKKIEKAFNSPGGLIVPKDVQRAIYRAACTL